MESPKKTNNPGKRLTFWSSLVAILLVVFVTIKEIALGQLKHVVSHLFESATRLFWELAHSLFRFLSGPVELSRGAYFALILALAGFGFLVLAGNLWIFLRGPRASQYTTDVFLGLRWSWSWSWREADSQWVRAIEELTPHCPMCDRPMDCEKPPYRPDLDDYGRSVEGRGGFSHPKPPTLMCRACKKPMSLKEFQSVEPCGLLMDTVRSLVMHNAKGEAWIEPTRRELAMRRKYTLFLPTLIDRWFVRR